MLKNLKIQKCHLLISERMRISGSGNILIGKTSQTNSAYLLDVAGSVRANQITVNATGADFVFDSNYELMPLFTLGAYIQANHHLPDIPAASQMQKDGLNLGQNEIKMLQNLEELTLYLIDTDKEIKLLQKELKNLKNQKQ